MIASLLSILPIISIIGLLLLIGAIYLMIAKISGEPHLGWGQTIAAVAALVTVALLICYWAFKISASV